MEPPPDAKGGSLRLIIEDCYSPCVGLFVVAFTTNSKRKTPQKRRMCYEIKKGFLFLHKLNQVLIWIF